eukprot:6664059-Pyramimonas_sp.AAC.1
MEASKAAETCGPFEGHGIEQADARQAYTQPALGGIPTWIFLPRDEWPEEWPHMRKPGGIGSNAAKGVLRLNVYADDFKLAGPADKLAEGWRLLQTPSPNCPKGMKMDPPTGVGRYLGCEHR